MPDKPDPDLDTALEAVLAAYARVEPPAGAAGRWRESIHQAARRRPDRFLWLSARAWAGACAVAVTLLLVASGFAWKALNTRPPVVIVRSAPPAPQAPAAIAPVRRARPAMTPSARPPYVAVALDMQGPPATAEEKLLARLTEQNPAVLPGLFANSSLQLSQPTDSVPKGGDQ